MIAVELEDKEWQQIVNILGTVNMPWTITNPLILKIIKQAQGGNSSKQINVGEGYGVPTQSN